LSPIEGVMKKTSAHLKHSLEFA